MQCVGTFRSFSAQSDWKCCLTYSLYLPITCSTISSVRGVAGGRHPTVVKPACNTGRILSWNQRVYGMLINHVACGTLVHCLRCHICGIVFSVQLPMQLTNALPRASNWDAPLWHNCLLLLNVRDWLRAGSSNRRSIWYSKRFGVVFRLRKPNLAWLFFMAMCVNTHCSIFFHVVVFSFFSKNWWSSWNLFILTLSDSGNKHKYWVQTR